MSKIDPLKAQITTVIKRLDSHDRRIARTEKFQAGEEDPDDKDPDAPETEAGAAEAAETMASSVATVARENRSSRFPASTANPTPALAQQMAHGASVLTSKH
jgi:hypothetical protein